MVRRGVKHCLKKCPGLNICLTACFSKTALESGAVTSFLCIKSFPVSFFSFVFTFTTEVPRLCVGVKYKCFVPQCCSSRLATNAVSFFFFLQNGISQSLINVTHYNRQLLHGAAPQ